MSSLPPKRTYPNMPIHEGFVGELQRELIEKDKLLKQAYERIRLLEIANRRLRFEKAKYMSKHNMEVCQ